MSHTCNQAALVAMEEEQSHTTETIFDLTLQIIYLLTGEKYAAVKLASVEGLLQGVYPPLSEARNPSQAPITKLPSHILLPESNKKILEVTSKIIELLVGEVSGAGNFSMEEERGQSDIIREIQTPLTSPDGSRKRDPPDRSPHPHYSQNSKKDQEIQHHDQVKQVTVKAEVKQEEEELYMAGALRCMVEEMRPETGADGGYDALRMLAERFHTSLTSGDLTQDSARANPVVLEIHSDIRSEATSTKLSEPEETLNPKPHTVTPNSYSGLHCDGSSTKLTKPEESQSTKSHTVTPNTFSGLYSAATSTKLREPEGTSSTELHVVTPDMHSGIQRDDHSLDPTSLEKSSPNIWSTVNPNVHSGFQSANQSCDPCRVSSPGKSATCTSHMKPRLLTVHQPPELLNLEEPFPDPSHSETTSISSGLPTMYRTLDSCNLGEFPPSIQCTDQSEGNAYPCFEGWKYFPSRDSLVEHRRTHTGHPSDGYFNQNIPFGDQQRRRATKKIFRCSECGICFTNSMDLVKHRYRIHAKEKPYPCAECGKCYTQKAHLVNHQRIHTGENIFPCSECGRRFTLKSQFIKHVRTHTGEKPYSCPECGRCFAQKSTLDNHQSVHTGQRPFSCLECGKHFVRKSTLQKHLEIHAGVTRKPKRS